VQTAYLQRISMRYVTGNRLLFSCRVGEERSSRLARRNGALEIIGGKRPPAPLTSFSAH
jgi:hypothetical protein